MASPHVNKQEWVRTAYILMYLEILLDGQTNLLSMFKAQH